MIAKILCAVGGVKNKHGFRQYAKVRIDVDIAPFFNRILLQIW